MSYLEFMLDPGQVQQIQQAFLAVPDLLGLPQDPRWAIPLGAVLVGGAVACGPGFVAGFVARKAASQLAKRVAQKCLVGAVRAGVCAGVGTAAVGALAFFPGGGLGGGSSAGAMAAIKAATVQRRLRVWVEADGYSIQGVSAQPLRTERFAEWLAAEAMEPGPLELRLVVDDEDRHFLVAFVQELVARINAERRSDPITLQFEEAPAIHDERR